MTAKRTLAILAVLASIAFALSPQAQTGMLPGVGSDERGMPTLAPLLERVTPGVVNIAVRGRVAVATNPLLEDPFFRKFFNIPEQPPEREFQAAGSGVIIDAENGYIITNNHVVQNAEEITVVTTDGQKLDATLVGTDPETDVAVVKVGAAKLTAVPLGNSDALKVGDFVIAVGNPFGLGQTVTSGIISALGRSGLGIEGYEDFIQTDASINPGNSGGALVNLRGELIGINTAIIGPSGGNVGIGFAIPVNMARAVMDQLIRHGEVHRGQLGVHIQDLTPDLATALGTDATAGAVVANVEPGSAAEKAGVKTGDVIVAVNGAAVRDASDLRNKIGLAQIGDVVVLAVRRGKETLSLRAALTPRSSTKVENDSIDPRLNGLTIGPIEPGSPLFGRVDGVEVRDVQPGSAAARAGLVKGDVIISVNRKPVDTPQTLIDAVKASEGPVLLNVRRGDAALFMFLR